MNTLSRSRGIARNENVTLLFGVSVRLDAKGGL